MPLLEIRGLKVSFAGHGQVVRAVDGADLAIEPERTVGVVGESACGKSVTALSIMGLIRAHGGRIDAGSILFYRDEGSVDLTKLNPWGKAMRQIRGKEISMIFQEPMTALNPVYSIGNQIMEAIRLHLKVGRREAKERAIQLLRDVGIADPERRLNEFPHQLSGGMRQRAMIAMALSCNPLLLIADEPTTALDVTIQAQVLDLMKDLREEYRAAILFITHDLGVVANIADEVIVMYLGRVVESAPVRELFRNPRHPYTRGLLNSLPTLTAQRRRRLASIPGVVPDSCGILPGCDFEPRCGEREEECRCGSPVLKEVAPGHRVACFCESS